MNFSVITAAFNRSLRRGFHASAALFTLSLAAPAFAVSEPSPLTGEKKSYQYSWAQEIQLGAEADKEISQQMGLYDNQDVQAYVDSVGQRVLGTSSFRAPSTPEMYRNTKFTFRVLDSPVVNAFALPGGYVYVTRGLLSHVDNEAQLAVVLGHEIAHVAARHASLQARRNMWGQLGVIAGAILGQRVLGERMPDIGSTILKSGGPAMQTFLLKYSREAEHEADTYGVTYAAKSGYAAADSARFFTTLQRLSAGEGKSLPAWQSSHPDPGDRANRVRQLAVNAAPGANNVGEDEFLRRINGMIVGEDPRQGFVQNGVFYHPELGFQMPVASGWKLDNQPTAVVLAEPNGRALMGLRMAPIARAREAAAQFVSENKIQVSASGDTVVNGLPTSVIVGQAAIEEGTVGVWNAFIEMGGKVYSILGYAPTQAFEQMRSTFENVAAGFSPLRDRNMTNIQPARLKIVRADRSAPFASFIPTSLPPSITPEEIAIMNQVSINQTVPQGHPLKIPDAQAMVQSQAITTTGTSNRYPTQNYPTYPPAQQPGYPQYPQQNPNTYPPSQNYPSTSYPNQQGQQGYPTNNPQNPQGYPPSNYPPSNQPNQYPSTQYPQQYPAQYPQQYPQQNYPQQQQTYPQQSYPQYPQQGTNQQQQQRQQQGPVWPR